MNLHHLAEAVFLLFLYFLGGLFFTNTVAQILGSKSDGQRIKAIGDWRKERYFWHC